MANVMRRSPRELLRGLTGRVRRLAGEGHLDLVGRIDDPLEATYLAGARIPVIGVPLGALRWQLLGVSVDPSVNPFVRTAHDLRSGVHTVYEGSALEHHYGSWHPQTAAAVLGVVGTGSTNLGQPPHSATLPWFPSAASVDPSQRLVFVDELIRAETRGTGPGLGTEHGHKLFGPVAAALGETEFARYRDLVGAIRQEGFQADIGGYIGVQLLVSGDTWVVLLRSGIHRAAAAAAFGIDPLTVAVSRRPAHVRREEAGAWPGVRSGLFTLGEALEVFDRIVDGAPPPGLPAAPAG